MHVTDVFITHAHADHILGLAGLLRTMSLYKRLDEIRVYYPKNSKNSVESLLKFDSAIISFEVKLVPVVSGRILKGKDFEVRAFRLNHSVECYGYVFAESDRLHFDKEKCKRLGIKGTMFQTLQKDKQINLKGRNIKLSEVSMIKRGPKFVYAADTRPCKSAIAAAKAADILVHEATYSAALAAMAKDRKHSTSAEAARVAKAAGVKKLVLTHFSTRYKNTKELLKDARAIFKETYAAEDGMKLVIK